MAITAEAQTPNFILDTRAPTWDADVTISNVTSIGFQADWTSAAIDAYFDTYVLRIRPIFQDGSLGNELRWDRVKDLALGNEATLTTTVDDAPIADMWNVDFFATDTFGWERFLVKKTISSTLGMPTNIRIEAYTIT